MPRIVDTVLLDVDGTLIKSNDAHAEAWTRALIEHGITVSFAVLRRMMGMGGDKILDKLAGVEEDSDLGRQIENRRRTLFRAKLPALEPCPGARELLERLQSDGRRLTVASSSTAADIDALLRAAGVRDLITAHASADDASSTRPDPDIVRAALHRSGACADSAVLIGDTPYDVAAGLRAGVPVIGLRCGGWDDEALTGAVQTYDSPAGLLEHYEGSLLKP